jgi:glycosyltransferase involved in cell wall biosynthesis
VGDVDYLGPITYPRWLDKMLRAMSKLISIFSKKEYATKYNALAGKYCAKQLKKKMRGKQYDFICAPAAAPELCYLKTTLPCIYIADTTFHLISNYYVNEFKTVSALSKHEGNAIEKKCLEKTALIIYSSQWAAESAINDYHANANKIFVMPFGANMDIYPSRNIISKKENIKQLTLLYLAVDWERKGGSIAFDALKFLHERLHLPAKLIVCGCIPPKEFQHPSMQVIPFLNKNIEEEHQKFISLLSECQFLILHTRDDCSLLVACEANAYGMPALTTNTGGVPDVVKDGINGYCFSYESGGEDYAQLAADIFTNVPRYRALIESSRQKFEEDLNWDVWGDKFYKVFTEKVMP